MYKKRLGNMKDVDRFMHRVHRNGYWGHHGIDGNDWIGYVMMLGIVAMGISVAMLLR